MTPAWLGPLIGFTLFSVVLAALCAWRPTAGRVVGGLLLLGGGCFNVWLGTTNPSAYASFGTLAVLDFYKAVVAAVFPAYGTPFILAIAAGQLASGAMLLLGGRWLRLGALGGLLFSLGIAPLGIGSAFPAPLFMALAYGLLLRHALVAAPARGSGRPRPHHP
jgi:hypothetical protein